MVALFRVRLLLLLSASVLVLGARAPTAHGKRGDRWDAALDRGEVLVHARAWVPAWIRTTAQKRTMPEMITRMRRAVRRR